MIVATVNLYTNAGNLEREALGVMIKQDLEELGMKVNFKPIEFNSLVNKLTKTFDWDMAIMGLTGSPLEPHDGINVWSSQGPLHMFNMQSANSSNIYPWEKRIDEIFEKAVAKKRKVKLLFKNQTVCECIPLQIVETDKKRYFKVYYKKERMIDINRLSGLEVTDNKFVSSYGGEQSVIFRLTAPLAQRYEPREGENTNMNADGSLDVINRTEPKEILFSRLMRYDTKCEIISPKSYRAEFQQMINDTLKNYEDLNG